MILLVCASFLVPELGPYVDSTFYGSLCCAKPLTICGPPRKVKMIYTSWLELVMYIDLSCVPL